MTNEQRFFTLMTALAEMCQHKLSKDTLRIYDTSLKHLGYAALAAAVEQIIQNRGDNARFPAISTIRNLIEPPVDPEAEALEASNRIVEALSRYGYADLCGAREFIGPLGWLIVEREGGWSGLCERVTTAQLPVLKAQWRELAKALQIRAKQGRLEAAPQIPPTERSQDRERGLGRPDYIGMLPKG